MIKRGMMAAGKENTMDTGMMYPKPKWKKKRKKHPPSIMAGEKGECFLCAKLHGDYTEKYTERHHVFFGGGLRDVSEQNGFTCNLCINHHREGPQAVHGNKDMREYLCRLFQEKYEETHTREDFMKLIGKDYFKTD